jgi:hypothetical protein
MIIALLSTFLFNTLLYEQDESEYRARVEELLREAIGLIKDARGLSLENVQVEIVTVDWARENWGKFFAEAESENILREERIYRALFMISEDESLYEARVEWWGMIAAAVWQDKIYIVKEYFNPYDRFNAEKTLVHELTHIMQSKYFNIPYASTFDEDRAKAALIEGDACLMEEVFANKTIGEILVMEMVQKTHGLLSGNSLINGMRVYASLPDSISRLNYFPYDYGLKFVKALYMEGGWQSVNLAYQNPPTTTEQIMHPEKYLFNETDRPVEALAVADGGWQKVKSERFGEYFILVMLEKWLPSAEATSAAEGWGGDNFTYYERGNDYLLTWSITWDSQEDALEFSESFKAMVKAVGAEEAENLWKKHGRYLSLTCEGNSTFIICSTDKTLVQKIGGSKSQLQYAIPSSVHAIKEPFN